MIDNVYDMPLGEFVVLVRSLGLFDLFDKLRKTADRVNETKIRLDGISNWKELRKEQEE